MTELPKSPLPEDPAYWARLARRIRADAAVPLAAYASREPWYGVLARRAPWLAAACLAAIAALWLSVPPRRSSDPGWLERSLSPDDVAGALVVGPQPPGVETLMAQFAPTLEDREASR